MALLMSRHASPPLTLHASRTPGAFILAARLLADCVQTGMFALPTWAAEGVSGAAQSFDCGPWGYEGRREPANDCFWLTAFQTLPNELWTYTAAAHAATMAHSDPATHPRPGVEGWTYVLDVGRLIKNGPLPFLLPVVSQTVTLRRQSGAALRSGRWDSKKSLPLSSDPLRLRWPTTPASPCRA
jgi:hypothetical protein